MKTQGSQRGKTASAARRSRSRLQRVVSVPHGYKRVAAQMDDIHRQFKDGASMTRLGRKHSLPRSTIEFIIRMKMLGHANTEMKHGGHKALILERTAIPPLFPSNC